MIGRKEREKKLKSNHLPVPVFSVTDVITVTDKTDQHWWTGELGNRRGLFPATYVTPYRTS